MISSIKSLLRTIRAAEPVCACEIARCEGMTWVCVKCSPVQTEVPVRNFRFAILNGRSRHKALPDSKLQIRRFRTRYRFVVREKKTYSYLVYATCFVYLSGIIVDTSDIHVVERRN